MKIIQRAMLIWLATGFIISIPSFSYATQKFKLKKNRALTSTTPTTTQLADLTFLKKAAWSSLPKEGQTFGSSAILNIFITNKGNAGAGVSRLKIELESLSGGFCPPSLNGLLNIPSLAPGKSVVLSWPQMSSKKWPSGKFRFKFFIDSQNKIKESNETNNKRGWAFNVQPKLIKTLKKKPKFIAAKPKTNMIVKAPLNSKGTTGKPDIIVTKVTPVPSDIKAGDSVSFEVTYKNIGGSNSVRTDGEVHCRVVGARVFSHTAKTMLPSLSPGGSVTVQSEQIKLDDNGCPVGGVCNLTVTADKINRIDEKNEDNNTLTSSVSIKPLTDLYVDLIAAQNIDKPGSKMVLKKLSVYAGNRVYFNITIDACSDYFGYIGSPGKIVIKATDFPDYVVDPKFIKSDNSHSGRDSFRFTLHRKWTTPGQKRITVHVDVDNQIEESKEFNNIGLYFVDVY